MLNKNLFSSLLLLVSLLLSACGNDDAQQAQTAPAPEATPAPVEPVPAIPQPEATPPVAPAETPAPAEPVAVEPAPVVTPEPAAPAVEPAPSVPAEPVAEAVPAVPAEAPAPAETPAVAAPAAETPAGSAPVDGGQIYNTYCAICHKAGMNAAPKFGNKALWAKRIAQGRETVYAHAINGLRGMPPRGGFADLTDEQVKAGVDYMVNASGGWGK